MTDEQFRELARQAIAQFGMSKPTGEVWEAFQQTLSFASAEPGRTDSLVAAIERGERAIGGSPGRLFHLAVPPAAFEFRRPPPARRDGQGVRRTQADRPRARGARPVHRLPRRARRGPGSDTETMAAVRAEIDNWRWAGVPFFLRSGKSLAASRQTLTLGFHQPPLLMFPIRDRDTPRGRCNEIIIDFADPGSITASFLAKEPGAAMDLGAAEMIFRYADSFCAANALEGYERLLLDAMRGDQSLFTRSDSIERLWEISVPLLDNPPPIQAYTPGSWGPQPSLDQLTAPYRWHLPGAGSG
jgi:glucose-6-phosphate 1-dehydrogenase